MMMMIIKNYVQKQFNFQAHTIRESYQNSIFNMQSTFTSKTFLPPNIVFISEEAPVF